MLPFIIWWCDRVEIMKVNKRMLNIRIVNDAILKNKIFSIVCLYKKQHMHMLIAEDEKKVCNSCIILIHVQYGRLDNFSSVLIFVWLIGVFVKCIILYYAYSLLIMTFFLRSDDWVNRTLSAEDVMETLDSKAVDEFDKKC